MGVDASSSSRCSTSAPLGLPAWRSCDRARTPGGGCIIVSRFRWSAFVPRPGGDLRGMPWILIAVREQAALL